MRKLRVAMTNDVYFPDVDGVISCVHNLMMNSLDLFDGVVVAPHHKNYIDEFPYRVIRVKSGTIPMYKNRFAMPKFDKMLKEQLDEFKPDIIHIHSPFGLGKYAIKYARENNIPVIATFHTDFRPIFRSIVKSEKIAEIGVKKLGKVFNGCDRVLVISDQIQKLAESYGVDRKFGRALFGTKLSKVEDKSQLVQRANEEFNLKEDETVFLYVGRTMKLKRIDYSLQMLKELKDRGEKFKFFVVGKGMDLDYLKQVARDLDLEDEVIFTGYLEEDKLTLLNARANLFLFPSLYDSWGLVKVEAAAFATPTICIEGSNASCGIEDGVNGFTCEDDLYAYADKVQQIIKDKNKLAEIGKEAQNTLYMTWRDASLALLDTYKDVIEEYNYKNNIKKDI